MIIYIMYKINDKPELVIDDVFLNKKIDYINVTPRKPDNENFKNPPILLFGCSFAYGEYLAQNQTFSYKLSKLLNSPVYNRAIPGFGV